jgi:hypothetical protein
VGSIAQASSVLIFVHNHVEPPVLTIFHAPMPADNCVESLCQLSGAEQVIGCFGFGLVWRLAYMNHLADGLEARPLILLSRSMSVETIACAFRCARDRPRVRRDGGSFALRIVE